MMGDGTSGAKKKGGGGGKPRIDTATTAKQAFDALAVGDYIELQTPGDRYSSGVWLVYQKTAWGLSRVSRPGYYSMPGDSMVMQANLARYDGRWRKLTDYNRGIYGL